MSVLPSWASGPTRDSLIAFLDDAVGLPVEARVAVFDNDGTLWCERPRYMQLDFMIAALHSAVASEPKLGDRVEYGALLAGDRHALAEIGLHRIGLALAELCAGIDPETFAEQARGFITTQEHPTLGRSYAKTVYQPMLELIDELRRRDFTVFVVTGGGTEFVRSVSRELYGVTPDRVVGTLVRYDVTRRDGLTVLLRTADLDGELNEGTTKVENIQRHLGQRPSFAAGNSPGDVEMIEYTTASTGPTLGLIVHHDDGVREFAYESEAVSFQDSRPFSETGATAGWTVASMRHDWTTVFSP